jgi:hypothetical protein
MHPYKKVKHILQLMIMLFHGGNKDNDVINISFGKSQTYKHAIHHPLVENGHFVIGPCD